jgi:hypothetical protein
MSSGSGFDSLARSPLQSESESSPEPTPPPKKQKKGKGGKGGKGGRGNVSSSSSSSEGEDEGTGTAAAMMAAMANGAHPHGLMPHGAILPYATPAAFVSPQGYGVPTAPFYQRLVGAAAPAAEKGKKAKRKR